MGKDAGRAAEAALILFAKAPVPGQVKTRLCPPLTPDEAASLHGSFVLDALERSRGIPGLDRFLACAPSANHVFFKIMEERQGVRLMSQVGDDLGARMSHALAAAFAQSYRHVLMVGTDLPTLSPGIYTRALALLAQHDLVLGPAMDGGYYLLGLNRILPELFVGIPWSTDGTLASTRQKADSLGLKTGLLPACRDVDTIEDLLALIEEEGLAARGTRQAAEDRSQDDRPASRSVPRVPRLSERTAGALRLLAERLRHR
jgi:rSAM/selenodomain-associated transferase 1